MKNLMIFSLIILAFGLSACLDEEKDDFSIKSNFKTEVETDVKSDIAANFNPDIKGETISGRPGVGIGLSGRLHRAVEENNNGKKCGCDACFGICDVKFNIGLSVFKLINITGGDDDDDGTATIYLLEEVEHAEPDFFVDEELVVPVLYGEELVDRTLQVGQYVFERSGVDYEDEDPEYPTFGRVRVNIQ